MPQIKRQFVSKIYVLIIACLLTAFGVEAQSGKVTGKVLNERNEPLPGVTVKVDGSQGGTSTDVEGRFTLTVSSGKKYTITFSAVGYAAKTIDEVEVAAGKLTELNITVTLAKRSRNIVLTLGPLLRA